MGIRATYNKLAHNTLMQNIASLGLVQLANYAIPLLIMPFITRALGPEAFGKASYAQNIIAYLTIIVNYGFEYTATQDVALNREDKDKTRHIFWSVMKFKTVLLSISLIALALLYFFFDKVNEDPSLYIYAWLINVGFVMFPTWFFQGMENMKKMAVFNFITKLCGAILTIAVVSSPQDYRLYILVLSLSYIAVGVVSFAYVLRKYDLTPYQTNKETYISGIKKGFPVFINNIFVSFYNVVGITIVGIYMSNSEVGIYSGGQKIVQAIVVLTVLPISISLFPRISRLFASDKDKAIKYLKKTTIISIALGIIVCFTMILLAPLVTSILLGAEFCEASTLIRIMSPLPMLVLIATILTVQGLYGMQKQKFVPFVGLACGSVSLALSLLLIPHIGVYGAIYAWIAAEVAEIAIDLIIIIRSSRKAVCTI